MNEQLDRINPSAIQTIPISTGGELAFKDASQMMEFAKLMAVSNVAIPQHLRDNNGACLAILIQASEWKMSPFAVANKSYSVNDRLAYEAQLVNAVILNRAPIKGRFKVEYEGKDATRTCTVRATLTDGEDVEYTSPPMGSITTKNSPLWKSDPDQQLFYFSSRSMCRRHFPDVILGVYTPDELDERPTTTTVARAEPINPFAKRADPVPEPEKIIVEAEYRDEPAPEPETQESPAEEVDSFLIDFLDLVKECPDAANLTSYVSQGSAKFEGAKKEMASKAIQSRAKELGVKWSKMEGMYV